MAYLYFVNRILVILALFLVLFPKIVSAQENKKTRVRSLDLYISAGLTPALFLKERQSYAGDFFYYPDKNSFPQISWVEFDSTRNLRNEYSSFGISGTFGICAWKGLYTGLYYQLLNINGYAKPGVTGSLFLAPGSTLFFMIGGQVGYKFQPIKSHLQWEILPLISFGSYYGNEYYGNSGNKWQFNLQLRNQYHFKNRWGIHFSPAYTRWMYRQKGESEFFGIATRDKSIFNMISMDVGLSIKLHIDRSL